jgi:hypothetical protein
MAPSEAICITSWRPFANNLWPGGGHSPRLACCGEGWQRKPRQPSSVRNWGDFSAILTNESCGDGGVGKFFGDLTTMPTHQKSVLCRD